MSALAWFTAAFAFVVCCPVTHAQCQLSGTVLHGGSPVPEAEIFEEYSNGEVSLGKTDQHGQFRVSASAVPPLWRKAVLNIHKNGFEPLTLEVPPGPDRCPRLAGVALELSSSPGTQISLTGTKLFIVPYDITGPNGSTKSTAAFNDMLRMAIYNKVQAFRTQLEDSVSGPLDEVGVAPLNIAVSLTDPEAIRAEGTKVNALGVITGLATQRGVGQGTAPGAEPGAVNSAHSVQLLSEFRVIPRYPAYQEYHLQISDDLPGTALDPITLSNRLHDVWGKRTTIALLVRALAIASDAHDKQQLQVIRSWIVALRARLGPDEAHLARELQGLKADVESELRK